MNYNNDTSNNAETLVPASIAPWVTVDQSLSLVGLEDYIYTWYESNAEQSYDNIEGKVVQKTRSKKFCSLKIKDSLLRFHPKHDEDNSFDPENQYQTTPLNY